MTSHVHSWTPIPLVVARYECACGATGRRDRSGAVAWRDDNGRLVSAFADVRAGAGAS